jgi:hypothetical protein
LSNTTIFSSKIIWLYNHFLFGASPAINNDRPLTTLKFAVVIFRPNYSKIFVKPSLYILHCRAIFSLPNFSLGG